MSGTFGSVSLNGKLHVSIASLPPSHLCATRPLASLLPSPADALTWLGDRCSIVADGRTATITVTGTQAIRQASSEWTNVCQDALVDTDSTIDEGSSRLCGPVALASFGFAWNTRGVLIIPHTAIVERDGARFVITTALDQDPADPIQAASALAEAALSTQLTRPKGLMTQAGRMTQNQWLSAVRRVIRRLNSGAASKVVMSRDMVVDSPTAMDERYLVTQLHEQFPSTWTYAVAGLVGATPEILASKEADHVYSRVLAGTAAPGNADELMSSDKNRREHALAVESVTRRFEPMATSVECPPEPSVIELPNVIHLATEVNAVVPDHSLLDVVAALHPTAAVCGTPTTLAYDLLESFEQTRRGRYSGPVGWVDANGDGEFGIALRCGQFTRERTQIRVFAGGGIMPDSVPEMELAETRAKMSPVLDALGV